MYETELLDDPNQHATTSPATTVVARFLDAIRSATIASAADLYSGTAVLDATVPGWRFVVHGADAVSAEYSRWFNDVSSFTELRRLPTPTGEVIEYFMTWTEDGIEHGAHHVHVLTIDASSDRIIEDHVFCGGRWPADLLAQMSTPHNGSAQ